MIVGTAIGAAISTVGVCVGMLAFGQSWLSSLGLALFVAFWGGAGFGSMLGGVAWATRAHIGEQGD